MSNVSSEGIILKRHNFGEADRVMTALTDKFGKISIVARGVRRITSRRAGNVEILNRVQMGLFKGKNYTLTEAQSLETFEGIKSQLTLSTIAFHLIELADKLLLEDQPNPAAYGLLLTALRFLEVNPRQIFVRAYEIKMMSLAGFWSVDRLHEVEEEMRNLLTQLETLTFNQIAEIDLTEKQAIELEHILRFYLEETIESSLKSLQVMKQLKR
jgi:recombinational DNA repair protein (RecF pathway)